MRAILERDFFQFAATRRYFVMRMMAVFIPLVVLLLAATQINQGNSSSDDIGQLLFAATYYPILMFVVFVSPAVAAHVLTEERRDNRLDVLRSAPMSALSIVTGRWLSRLAMLLTMIVASLALPSMSLLFGGVSHVGFWRGALLLVLTAVSISSISILIGATTRNVATAVRLSYVTVLVMIFLPSMLAPILSYLLPAGGVEWWRTLLMISPFEPAATVMPGRAGGFFLGFYLSDPVISYGVFVAVSTPLALLGAAWLLVRDVGQSRAAPVAEGPVVERTAAARVDSERRLGSMAGDPLLWIETHRSTRRRRPIRTVLTVLLVALAEVAFFMGLFEVGLNDDDSEGLHLIAVILPLLGATLAIASAGAVAVHRDAEANTRDILFSSPVTSGELAEAKLVGARRAGRLWIGLSLLHLALGMFLGAINPLSGVAFVAILYILVYCLSGFAVRFGLTAKSATRANVRVLGWVIGLLFIWPIFAGLLMLASRSTGAAALLYGFHPGFLAAAPFAFVTTDGFDGAAEFVVIPAAYLLGYAVFGVALNRDAVPMMIEDIREDRVA